MEYSIFISHAGADKDIIENFRGHLRSFGVTAWVYSLDRTLAKATWPEIEERIRASDMMIFAVSQYTGDAEGQERELEIALDKIESVGGKTKIFPIVLRDTPFSALPDRLKHVNGERLNGCNVKSVAWRIARRIFPGRLEEEAVPQWRFPVPGEWLQVSGLDEMIEEYFDIGDKLYFRAISPMGLFECYAPKLKGLFWIAPENVRISTDLEKDRELEGNIPFIYQTSGMVEIYCLGWEEWRKHQGTGDNS